MNKQQMIELLKKDVVPALGCTEPVCVALCAAYAGSALEGNFDSVCVEVNPGIYKNGMSAGIPNCSKVGLEWAAAIGACLSNPAKSLELLSDVTQEVLAQAEELVGSGKVRVSVKEKEKSLYVKCTLCTEQGEAVCVVRNAHTNVVHLSCNGTVMIQKEMRTEAAEEDPAVMELKQMKISEILELVSSASEEELAFLKEGIEMNERLASYSETHETGVGIAASVRKEMSTGLLADDLVNRIVCKVASAAESRLDGCPLPTMSSSGAGTKGLVVILPVSETAKALGASGEQTVRAIAFAHLVNRYINAYVGKLSPMCSCVMASSIAAAAGITLLLGGTDEQIGHAIRNMTGTVTGMICDGGKVGCAMKVATGSFAALISAVNAVNHAVLRVSDGICARTPEQCIRNMARIGIHGMSGADKEILEIMTGADTYD